MEYPGIDKPDTIDHGPKNGFNCSASLGMIYQAMGVHSAVISGRKQIDYIDRNEMVCKDLHQTLPCKEFAAAAQANILCPSTAVCSLSPKSANSDARVEY